MNSKRRCIYKFVTYIILCKSRGDFDINTCLFFDHRKGDICDFVMYIIAGEDMCSEVLLAKRRLATHMPFFHDFGVCIK